MGTVAMPIPAKPKIYHLVHVDRLPAIVADGYLWCDAVAGQGSPGTTIGMDNIKQRRLSSPLSSRPGVQVGDCVPFYFCPRSIMLYLIYKANHPDLAYKGGQGEIIHLEADLYDSVSWAGQNDKRWAFTSSNAGSYIFDDYCDFGQLDKIDWVAVQARQWQRRKEGKQAEFLLEGSFPWCLIERIGIYSQSVHWQVVSALPANGHRPPVEIIESWYYWMQRGDQK